MAETELTANTDSPANRLLPDDADQAANDDVGDDIEARAREGGWVPEAEWEGEPPDAGFRTAQEFVDYGENRGPTRDEQNRRLSQELAASKRLHEETQTALSEFKTYHDGVAERAKADALTELEAKQREAVEAGDIEGFDEAQKDIKALDKPAEADSPDNDPVFKAWNGENDWYNGDIKMTLYANNIAPIVSKKTRLEGRPYYDAIAAEVRKEFPGHFRNSKRDDPPSVEGGGKPGGERKSGKKTYADLPREAKDACDRFCKQTVKDSSGKSVPLMTKAQYVEQYDWSE